MSNKVLSYLAIIVVVALATSAVENAQARIYKTLDKDGNVVFTDVPPNDDTKAVELETYSTYTPSTQPTAVFNTDDPDDSDVANDENATTSYSEVRITSPTADQSLRANNGNITVTIDSLPPLDTEAGHTLQVFVDGNLTAQGPSNSLTLNNIDRGSHLLKAQIADGAGEVLAASAPIEIHLKRVSILLKRPLPKPPSKPIPPQPPRPPS